MIRSALPILLCLLVTFSCALPFADLVAQSAAKKRVLYLGDSQSIGEFGKTFDSALRSSNLEVYTVVAGGTSPYYWLKAFHSIPSSIGYWEKFPDGERRLGYIRAVPKIENLMERHKPDIVVVQTGINLYATLRSKRKEQAQNYKEVKSLIDQMCFAISQSGAQSYWILPPHSHESKYPAELQNDLRDIMREVVTHYKGTVFESQQFTKYIDPYPATDGIHYGPDESRAWARQVVTHFSSYMKMKPGQATPVLARALPLQSSAAGNRGMEAGRVIGDSAKPSTNEPVTLVLKLLQKSQVQNVNEVEYSNALGLFEYEVVDDKKGNYQFDRIRVAHGIMFQRKMTTAGRRKIGETTEITLVPFDTYQNLKKWKMVDDLRPNFNLPIYTPKLN